MVRYKCHTNVDAGRNQEWPTDFVYPPKLGESVRSEGGYTLKVVDLTHCVERSKPERTLIPYVLVELNQ